MSWFAVKLEKARRQKEAVEVIRELGGHVAYDYNVIYSRAEPPVAPWLRELFGDDFFFDVVFVCVFSEDCGDDEAVYLKRLTNLKVLCVGTAMTDAGLEHLKSLTNLFDLVIDGTEVTPEGVKKLQEALPDCEIELRHKRAMLLLKR
jgi:hypothetical protein